MGWESGITLGGVCQLSDCERRRRGACEVVDCVGAVRGRGRAGVRSMRRCGVCFVVVHGRVEAVGLENAGVHSWAAFSTREDWSSSVLVVPKCECVCSTAFGVCDAGPSRVCLSAMSNCRKANAWLLYLASSGPRLGPEECTRIRIGGIIVPLHIEKKRIVVWVSWLYLYVINSVLCKCKCSHPMTTACSCHTEN